MAWFTRRDAAVGTVFSGAFVIAAVVGSSAPLASNEAYACSCSIESGPLALPQHPYASSSDFPRNGLFTSSTEWRDASGGSLVLVRDDDASERLGIDVRRPSTALEEGATYVDASCTGSCGRSITIGSDDVTAPSAATLDEVRVTYADDAPETGVSCQTDTLSLRVGGTDDRTPASELTTVAYVGATAEEVAATLEPSATFARDPNDDSSTIVLGGAEGHRRDEAPLRASGPFCFAVALMDHAGNVGARSATRCIDTTDPADPAIEFVPYAQPCSGAFCSVSHRRAGSASLGGLGIGIVLLLARRRAR